MAAKAHADRIVTSTLGYGEGYDETLLAAIARCGTGNHVFADDPDAAGAAIAQEVDGLLDKVVQAATLTVEFEPTVQMLRLYNDLPAQQIGDGPGDDRARRPLRRRAAQAADAALRCRRWRRWGWRRSPRLELQYVELPGLVEHTVSLADLGQRGARRRGGPAGPGPDGPLGGALPGGAGREAVGVGGVRAR